MKKLICTIIFIWVLILAFISYSFIAYAFLSPKLATNQPLALAVGNSAIEKAGIITQDETWSGEILITEDIIVPEGVTLKIEAGTVVKFKHCRDYKELLKLGIVVHGTLKALGTPENQIWFTSDAEDPMNGDWRMIRLVNAEASSLINYSIIEFAQQGINLWNSSPRIANSIVRWNNWEGIYLESYCEPLIEYCLIYENGYNGIAMEQFNNATVQYCTIWRSGTNGFHVDASNALAKNNIIKENRAGGLSVDDHGTLKALNNTLQNNEVGIGCGEGSNTVLAEGNKFEDNQIKIAYSSSDYVENVEGNGAGEIFYDYPDSRPYELGYIPGDPEKDRYSYIYPDEDETRRIINKIGEGLGLTWSLAWDGESLWTATLWGAVFRLNPENGEIMTQWVFQSPQPWGMTYDGENLWINDFAEKRVYETSTNGTVISYFDIPDQEGGAKGIAWDGEHLCIMGWTSPTIYRVDTQGNLIDTILVKEGAGGGLTWDGEDFWAPGGVGIVKINIEGETVGSIYAASEGTWDLAWDGNCLWATQRTNENWLDAKLYQIEIIDDTIVPESSTFIMLLTVIITSVAIVISKRRFQKV